MNDRAEEGKMEIQETNKTPEKAGRESTIGDDTKQKTWGTANERAHENDVHPSEVEGIKAIDSFGIDFGDGSVLTAKGLDSKDRAKEVVEDNSEENLPPAVSTEKMMKIAKREHDHPTKWKSSIGLCNQFLDIVAREAGMKLPWKAGHQPRSGGPGGMNEVLNKSHDFDKVWSTDYSNLNLSLQKFQSFEMQPGDLVIWDVPDSIQKGGISHSAIATGSRDIIYAGSKDINGNGCGHCDIKWFSGTPEDPYNFNAPTSIYRYKNMTK